MIRSRAAALTLLYLLVVCAVGMLHPVRNALVLGALGGSGFYKVYLASALVAFAIVPFNRLAVRIPQQRLTPAVATFFAVNLVLFRMFFPGGVLFGVLFYAWHDFYAGILISQFFLATSEVLDQRNAKKALPVIIAAGSVGAAIGGAVTGFLAPAIGVANLLLIAAALTFIFAIALPAITGGATPKSDSRVRVVEPTLRAPIRDVVRNRQVQLIAGTVVLTVLVKQIVDYQFNTASASLGDREAVSTFQGKFNAATQCLPLLAALAIRPALAQWGVGAALLMLPAGMIVTNLIVGWRGGLGPAALAKGTEMTLRYSAERTGREILYMPVSARIRARAKPIIDVGLESGLAKALSAGVIFVLLATVGPSRLAWACVALSVIWLGAAVAQRRVYVRSLASAVRVPMTGLAELSATLNEAAMQEVVGQTLASGTPAQIAFIRDLLAESATPTARSSDPAEGADGLLDTAADGALELPVRTAALHKLRRLRTVEPTTYIARDVVQRIIGTHLDAAEHYRAAGATLQRSTAPTERDRLLQRAIVEAWQTRQTAVFDGLGVIHESRVVEGCYRAITGSNERHRASALELIEEAGSRQWVRRLDPILRATPDYSSYPTIGDRSEVIAELQNDDDWWVAQCAAYSGNAAGGHETMQIIERVFLLQRVDIFAATASQHLARIALVTREVEVDDGAVLLHADQPADAMYVVIDGELRASARGATRSITAGEAVGALALLDDTPLALDVLAVKNSRLLRLTKRDLHDLLHDHPDLAVSLLHGMATRLRGMTS